MTKIEELKQALAAAPPGPWWRDDDTYIASGFGDDYITVAEPFSEVYSELIIEAHNALPTLIAIAETLMQYPKHPMMNVRWPGEPSLADLLEKLK